MSDGLLVYFPPPPPIKKCFHQGLARVAPLAARTLYKQAGGAEERLASINADELTVRTGDLHRSRRFDAAAGG